MDHYNKIKSFKTLQNHKKDIAYTAEGLPPHVDNPYRDPSPMFQLLHTLENDCELGKNINVMLNLNFVRKSNRFTSWDSKFHILY